MTVKEHWGSRIAILIAVVSMAIGTGNIWRFPRVASEWGGGAFLIAVTVGILVWALPLVMAEFFIGSKTRLGNIGAFRKLGGRKFTWGGSFMVFVTIAIMFYYSVVSGWCLRYLTYSLTGSFHEGVNGDEQWAMFIENPVETVGFHLVAVLITLLVVYRGIRGGLERVLKIFLPSLLVILIILAIRAVTLPGSIEGLRYLFVPQWEFLLKGRVWLEAFTQVAWSTGAGWGLIMVYAVYAREKEDIGVNSGIICFSDVLAGMLASMVVLCTIFAVSPSVDYANEALGSGNIGLTFIYIVELIVDIPGSVVIAPLFFLALSIAGISSLIAMFELSTTNLINFGFTRRKAAILTASACFLFGIPSAVNIGFLDNQDWVWGVGLLISGLLTSLVIIRFGVGKARKEIDEVSDIKIGLWWSVLIRFIPVVFVIILGWWVLQSIQLYPGNWWNPLETFSTGTMLVQWGLLFICVYLLNNYFSNKIKE